MSAEVVSSDVVFSERSWLHGDAEIGQNVNYKNTNFAV